MEIRIDFKNPDGSVVERKIRRSYLVKFVDPEKEYPVSYKIGTDGARIESPGMLLGKDLTENQIADLFIRELL
jgi:hypothetical protein